MGVALLKRWAVIVSFELQFRLKISCGLSIALGRAHAIASSSRVMAAAARAIGTITASDRSDTRITALGGVGAIWGSISTDFAEQCRGRL